MEINFIIYLLSAVTITSLIWYVYASKLKSKYENLNSNLDKELIVKSDSQTKDLLKTINELKASIPEIKQKSFTEGYDKAKSELSISVIPFKKEIKTGDAGFLINDIYHEVTLGYKYQLFINGIPALQPAIIIEDVLVEKKSWIDYEKVDKALKIIETKLIPLVKDSKGVLKILPSEQK